MFALLLLTTAIPLAFGHFELRAGQSAQSPALIADAREYRVHALTTGLAIVAVASQHLGLALDRAAAVLIVLAVLKMGWDLLRDAMRVLLDASLDPETLNRIRAVIDSDPTVTEVRWVTGRNAGRYRFVEAGLVLRPLGHEKVERGVRRIESAVRAAVPRVERVLIQVESPSSPYVNFAVPLASATGPVSTHFGSAPFFAILAVRRDDRSIADRRIVANPVTGVERGKGMRVAEWLVEQKVDVVLSHEDLHGKGPSYVLRDAGVELRLTEAQDPEVAVAAS
jgi:predicted Fe-Mo cluster-binding NifX family protein